MENIINLIEQTKIDFYQHISTIFSKNDMLDEVIISLSKSHIIVGGKKINELDSIKIVSIKYHTPNQSIIYFPTTNQFSIKNSKMLGFLFQLFNFSPVINLEFKYIISHIYQEISQHDFFNTSLSLNKNNEVQKNETWIFKRKELEHNKFSFFGEVLNKKLEFLEYQNKLSLHKPFIKSSLKFKI